MKVIDQSFYEIDEKRLFQKIELCGRVCYKSEDKITEDSALNFVKKICVFNHGSVLEHYAFVLKIDNEYYEGIMLQGMLIGLAKEDFSTILEYIKCFVPKINNWSVCDTFCAGLKITKKHKQEMWDFIKIYLKSNKEFEIRFAIVMILDYYIEKEYLSKIFRIFNETKSEYYYVKMAVAWAISICLIKYYDETLEYLKNTNIDVFTYNKALQKGIESYRIDDIKKQTLRKMKK